MRRNDSATDHGSLQVHTRETMKSALDLRILGVCCGSGLNQLDFALVRYLQASPSATLYLELIQVSVVHTVALQMLTNDSAVRYLPHLLFETTSSLPSAKLSATPH